ncbi:unnamed protein product, partial [Staurois parvus]
MSLLKFFNFLPVPSPVRYVPTSQGTEPGRRMSASAGGDGWGRWQGGHRAGVQDKVSAEEIPEQCCSVFLSVAQGYRFW